MPGVRGADRVLRSVVGQAGDTDLQEGLQGREEMCDPQEAAHLGCGVCFLLAGLVVLLAHLLV